MRKKYRTGQEGDSLKFTLKEDGKKLLVVCIASFLMAVNIKSFVHTGGLYPGGVTGLTLLIQRAAESFLHIGIPFTLINVILHRISFYRKEIYTVFLPCDCVNQCADGYHTGACHYL